MGSYQQEKDRLAAMAAGMAATAAATANSLTSAASANAASACDPADGNRDDAPDVPPPRRPARRQPRILVADDDRDAADGLAALLGLYDYEAHAVYDGEQALDAAQAFNPDLVILDLGMPVMNGFEAARRLRQDPLCRSDLVLIALTGKTRAEDSAEVLLAGFDFHLSKPVDPGELCHLIGGVLSHHRSG